MKGDSAGTGLVMMRLKNELEWKVSNAGKSLAPEVEDVQAVQAVNNEVFLAGTWKNGLFRSDDTGLNWNKISEFPAVDVRSLLVVSDNIYAVTISHGILISTDLGLSWTQCAHDSLSKSLASWRIYADPQNENGIYALSFFNGLQYSVNKGKSWQGLKYDSNIMFYDMEIDKNDHNHLVLVGSGDSLAVIYETFDHGKNWNLLANTPLASFNQVALLNDKANSILVGTWDQGLFVQKSGKWKKVKSVDFDTISGIQILNNNITVYTWGNGIYKLE
jgi:photosystem II stability/assembly factor-like uncharacterized protein